MTLQSPPDVMLEIEDEWIPVRGHRAGAVPRAAPVRLAAQRTHLSARVPAGVTARSRDLAPFQDSFVDELIAGVVERGHPLVRAHFPRCYVDVNRGPYELDPRMFDGRLPSFANTRSMRVAAASARRPRRRRRPGKYTAHLGRGGAAQRIDGLYEPYHRALRRVFMQLHRDFGAAVLIDCHSMPSATGAKDERPRADLVIGDRYGASCVAIVAETIEETMRGFGYVGQPQQALCGGFITEHYGNPAAGLHAIQLEINRALYVDERRLRACRLVRQARRRIRVRGRPVAPNSHWKSTALPGGGGMTACAARGLPRLTEEKGPPEPLSGPSLGRKRQGATVTREKLSTLPHCDDIRRAAPKSRPADHFPLILPANGAELCLPVRMTVADTGGSQKTEECRSN